MQGGPASPVFRQGNGLGWADGRCHKLEHGMSPLKVTEAAQHCGSLRQVCNEPSESIPVKRQENGLHAESLSVRHWEAL